VSQPSADPLGRLPDRDARVAVPDQNDVVEIPAYHLVHDVLDVGLLPGRNALLLGQTGQCHRIAAMASRTHVRDDVVPRPRPEPGPRNKYEFRHGGKLARRYVRLATRWLHRRSC
jgi:hypothetical protein